MEDMKETGLTIQSDGWSSNKDKRGFHNFLCSSQGITFYRRSLDTTGIPNTGEQVLADLKDEINHYGSQNVICVTLDNHSSNVMAMRLLISEPGYKRECACMSSLPYPTTPSSLTDIFFQRCQLHTTNIFMRFCVEGDEHNPPIEWIADLLQAVDNIVSTFSGTRYYPFSCSLSCTYRVHFLPTVPRSWCGKKCLPGRGRGQGRSAEGSTSDQEGWFAFFQRLRQCVQVRNQRFSIIFAHPNPYFPGSLRTGMSW